MTAEGVPADDQFPVPLEETLDGTLGLELISLGTDESIGRFAVTNVVRQRWGLVHGGAYAAMAELIASEATNHGVFADGDHGVGLSNSTSFLRPVFEGIVHARARRRHRGRTTWIWDVDLTDDKGRICATSRVTIAIRPRR